MNSAAKAAAASKANRSSTDLEGIGPVGLANLIFSAIDFSSQPSASGRQLFVQQQNNPENETMRPVTTSAPAAVFNLFTRR
jgi:hypothetical protein